MKTAAEVKSTKAEKSGPKECRINVTAATSTNELIQELGKSKIDITKTMEVYHDRGTGELVFTQSAGAKDAKITIVEKPKFKEDRGKLIPIAPAKKK